MIPHAENRIPPINETGPPISAISFVLPGATSKQDKTEQDKTEQNKHSGIFFQSQVMKEFHAMAIRYAQSNASVLITGETGTGKELFSRLIHQESGRPKECFAAFSCPSIVESLMESEIFGHERGAFTGADRQRTGLFESADGGTLLLDEISEVPISFQAKLLRVIEEQEVQRVGSNRPKSIDVRIVATSNRDLKKEVLEGRFRADLYYRLNVLELRIPPLRERVADIPLLTTHFVSLFRDESRFDVTGISKEAMAKLCKYHWPGNVRELRNVIHRACVNASGKEIQCDAIPYLGDEFVSEDTPMLGMTLAEIEKRIILASLKKFEGNKKSAANELGVTARTLSNKLKHYQSVSDVVSG